MDSLIDIYNTLSAADEEILEKQAAEIKLAEEEDAAGRIMARGFADELEKIAQGSMGERFDLKQKANRPLLDRNAALGGGIGVLKNLSKRNQARKQLAAYDRKNELKLQAAGNKAATSTPEPRMSRVSSIPKELPRAK